VASHARRTLVCGSLPACQRGQLQRVQTCGHAAARCLDLRGLEKSTTDKAKVIATLKDSFAHAKAAIKAMPDADLEKSLDWFGGKNTERGILLFITRHAAEHLGQSIAYARMAGVTPPWTEDAKKPPEKKEAAKDKQ
jgi:uncharacterized damage-inducible protein DinB